MSKYSLSVFNDPKYSLDSFFEQSIGFDPLFDTMSHVLGSLRGTPSYPPYDIIKDSDDSYRLRMALAGFTKDDIKVEVKDNVLSVSGEQKTEDVKEDAYIYHGIARRSFSRTFNLDDNTHVTDAKFDNGVLNIQLKREIPKSEKPKLISIK